MHVELVDRLRCPNPHESAWLIAAAEVHEGRRIVHGTLGCHLCAAEFAVREGVVWMADDAPVPRASSVTDDDTTRLAALLGLTERGAVILLQGAIGSYGVPLATLSGVRAIAIDPPATVADSDQVGVVRVGGGRVPVSANAWSAVAVASSDAVAAAAVAVRAGGRLVAPADAPLPSEFTLLARDARQWVAERVAGASAPVTLRRAPRTDGR
ncbi:MAG: hypothetical protein K2X99_13325 [Gemmatimonadaceae bacterium]|nr:hypothetical protein [Gemmatimonadaceae bacterium]